MSSENPSGADNQQERLLTNDWLVGFVDGEGCFSCPDLSKSARCDSAGKCNPPLSSYKEHRVEACWRTWSRSSVAETVRQPQARQPSGRSARFYVSRFGDLRDVIVPFFQANPLRTAKRAELRQVRRSHRSDRSPTAPSCVGSHRDRGDCTDDELSEAVRGVENPQRPYADPLPALAGRRRDDPDPVAM